MQGDDIISIEDSSISSETDSSDEQDPTLLEMKEEILSSKKKVFF